jgi:hypothetical protein
MRVLATIEDPRVTSEHPTASSSPLALDGLSKFRVRLALATLSASFCRRGIGPEPAGAAPAVKSAIWWGLGNW